MYVKCGEVRGAVPMHFRMCVRKLAGWFVVLTNFSVYFLNMSIVDNLHDSIITKHNDPFIIIIIIISLTSIFFQDKSRVWTAASQQH